MDEPGLELFLIWTRHPVRSTLFPYTTLFRSLHHRLTVPTVAVSPHGRHKGVTAITLNNHRGGRSEEHTSELQSHSDLVCRLLLEKKNHPYRQLPVLGNLLVQAIHMRPDRLRG